LFAAASLIVAALWSRGAQAHHGAHCFLRGTLIRTPSGEREISSLAIGDLVVTHSGQEQPIKWIGRQRLHRQAGKPWSAPVKVGRSALAEGVPHRDLYLSPWHALYLDGLLVTVGSLVNGSAIVRCDADERQTLEYFNLELAEPDLIFAEGVPSETLFCRSADCALFDNWSERVSLATPIAQPIAPEANVTGARLQLRSRLRSALAPLVDRRTGFDKLRDRIEDRAEQMRSAA